MCANPQLGVVWQRAAQQREAGGTCSVGNVCAGNDTNKGGRWKENAGGSPEVVEEAKPQNNETRW